LTLYLHCSNSFILMMHDACKFGLQINIFLLYFSNVNIIFCPFFQSYMDSEIRTIMAQYMPLDSQGEVPNHTNDEDRT
jgi:hypothetical protein